LNIAPAPSDHQAPDRADDRHQGEDRLHAVADLLAKSALAGEQLTAFAQALGRLASAHGTTAARLREQVRRNGYPVPIVVTVRTPTGTECRRVIRHVGGWSA
jgi:hypothetical protein